MLISLPWANPRIGVHTDPSLGADRFEQEGFQGLIYSSLICFAIGIIFLVVGRGATGKLFRKEAMAVVGMSWLLATFLGALPFIFSGTLRGPSVRVFDGSDIAFAAAPRLQVWQTWLPVEGLEDEELKMLGALSRSGARGMSSQQLKAEAGIERAKDAFEKLVQRPELSQWLICLLYTSPSPRDATLSRMPSSA